MHLQFEDKINVVMIDDKIHVNKNMYNMITNNASMHMQNYTEEKHSEAH